MKRQGGLFDRLVSFHHLQGAAVLAARGKHRSQEVARFLFDLEIEILRLRDGLMLGTYRPGPFRVFEISDPKRRVIAAAPFRDRVVHHAICLLLEPVFERFGIHDSYACRIGKGPQKALRRAQQFLRSNRYFLKLDVTKYFASVDHAILKRLIRRKIKDARFLDLIDLLIDHTPEAGDPGRGLPIGNLTSQHFANFYLSFLDHFVLQEIRPGGYVRYMDDMVLFAPDKRFLRVAHAAIAAYLSEALSLSLNESATILAPAHQGLPFLGFRVFPGVMRLQRQSLRRFRRKLRSRHRDVARSRGEEATLIDSIRSLVGYVQHGDTRNLRRFLLDALEPSME